MISKPLNVGGPALSVTGVTKAHAQRAIRWLKVRMALDAGLIPA